MHVRMKLTEREEVVQPIETPNGIGLSPDADFSAGVARAVNDAVIEEWQPTDSRFRACIVIAPNDSPLINPLVSAPSGTCMVMKSD